MLRAVRGYLGAGVTGAEHHEGAAGFPFGVVAAGGQLELAQEVVTIASVRAPAGSRGHGQWRVGLAAHGRWGGGVG